MDKVSIVLRSKNEEHLIGKTLDGILNQECGVDLEILLVDSGSSDKTLEIAKRFPVKIFSIPAKSFSYGFALNYGIERSSGNIICNLSAHCVPANSFWLESLIEPILKNQADACYGRQVPFKGVNPWEEYQQQKLFPDTKVSDERTAFSNANCAFRKSLWASQPFDEDLPRWEDYHWYLQLQKQYTFAYCPKASVYHSHKFNLSGYRDMCRKDGQAHAQFRTRHGIALPNPKDFLGKTRLALQSMAAHTGFFMKEKYFKELLMVPVVITAGYLAYLEGARQGQGTKRFFKKQCAVNLKA